MSFNPITLGEASVSIWAAGPDGLPLENLHATQDANPLPDNAVLSLPCTARVTISASHGEITQRNFSTPGTRFARTGLLWRVEISNVLGLDGNAIDLKKGIERFSPVANFIVVVRWQNEDTGAWTKLQFFDAAAVPVVEAGGISSSASETLSFSAGWKEERGGAIGDSLPSLTPEVSGMIELVQSGHVLPVYTYDFGTDTFAAIGSNPSTGTALISGTWEFKVASSVAGLIVAGTTTTAAGAVMAGQGTGIPRGLLAGEPVLRLRCLWWRYGEISQSGIVAWAAIREGLSPPVSETRKFVFGDFVLARDGAYMTDLVAA